MSYSIGGALIADMEFTRSWGLSPSSASITCVGPISVLVGGDSVLSIGGATFYGVLSSVVDEMQDGTHTKLSFVDNRVKLMWDDVYALFNRVEVREDDLSTPGIDRSKRYVHILPANADKQIQTITNAPYSARQIINFLFGAVDNPWVGIFHSAQESPVHEIDCLTGKKLGNVLQEITEAQGLVFTLVGSSQLQWVRKGEANAPGFDSSSSDRSSGEALSAVDTRITVVGDRNRYQDLKITLEPDWVEEYQPFVFEPKWLDEVSGAFGLPNESFADRAALAAKARKVTVRDYALSRGSQLSDFGMWGEVSRMEIPVWTYLQDIVFKAYRVPRSYQFNGVPLDSLALVEGLLCAVTYGLDGAMNYSTEEDRLYPDGKAFCLVRGQQLSLIDPTKQRVLSDVELARAGQEWSPCNRFNLDTRNKVIIFEDQIFQPGSGGLFVFLNAAVPGANESLKAIAVPNAAASVTPANVKVSLVWDVERYKFIYGSGQRKGPHYVSGLSIHKLYDGGSDQGQVSYADGETADVKAQRIAQSLASQDPTYVSGGFLRNGGYGTQLTPAIDRVTTTLTFAGGISERIEYSKERSQSNFESERELERRQRSRELFPGQRSNKADVEHLELIAKVSKELKRSPLTPVYGSLAEAMEKPVGAKDCSVNKVYSPDIWLAGQTVFLGDDDVPSQDGNRFAGIVIADRSTGIINLATQGIVPVRVLGPIAVGDTVGIDQGPGQTAKKDGKLPIGAANAAYSGSNVVLLPVRLGVSTAAPETPFQVVMVGGPSDLTVKVIDNSHLLNTEDKDTYEEDNADWGLDTPFMVGDPGFKIWLEIKLSPDDQSVIDINVRREPVGGAGYWKNYPDPISINVDDPANPYQEFYNQIIAEVTNPEEDPRPGLIFPSVDGGNAAQVTQLLFSNILMTPAHTTQDADQPGLPLLVALTDCRPGTSIDGAADPITAGDDIMTPYALGEVSKNETPFQVVFAGDADHPYKVKVIANSHLLNSEDKDTYEENNSAWGLNTPFDVNVGDKIWLEIKLSSSDQSIVEINVKHGAVGTDGWDEYPDPISINVDDPANPFQEFYNQIIAEITEAEEDPRPGLPIGSIGIQVTQLLFTNLMMTSARTTADADQPGLPILVALAGDSRPGTDEDGNASPINDRSDVMTPWEFGGGVTGECPFALYDASTGAADARVLKVGVRPSTLDNTVPEAFVDGVLEIAISGYTEIYGHVTIDSDGDVTETNIESGSSMPADTATEYYVLIGSAKPNDDSSAVDVTNYRYGPLDVTVCRDWFSNPAAYGVAFSAVACAGATGTGGGGGGSGSGGP